MSDLWLSLWKEVFTLAAQLLGALGIRWLMEISTPQEDWAALKSWWHDITAWNHVPDRYAGINMAVLNSVKLRHEWEQGRSVTDSGIGQSNTERPGAERDTTEQPSQDSHDNSTEWHTPSDHYNGTDGGNTR